MPNRRAVTLVVAAAAVLAACGTSASSDTNGESATVDGTVVAVGGAPLPGEGAGSIGDAVEVAAGAPGDASVAACAVDRQTLETAMETYELLNGDRATSQQDLVDADMIREPSPRFVIDAGGSIVPAPGSPCG